MVLQSLHSNVPSSTADEQEVLLHWQTGLQVGHLAWDGGLVTSSMTNWNSWEIQTDKTKTERGEWASVEVKLIRGGQSWITKPKTKKKRKENEINKLNEMR